MNSDKDMLAEIRTIIKTGTTSEISETLNDYAGEIKQIWADNKTASLLNLDSSDLP